MMEQANIIVIYDNQDFSEPIEYVFDLIFSTYGVSYKIIPFSQLREKEYNLDKTLAISYRREYLGCGAKKQIHIYASDFFGRDYLKPSSMPQTPLKKYDDLPVIYSGHGSLEGWVRECESLIETNIDIIAAAFFMLARYEEVVLDVKDRHDRFPATASLAYKEGFLDTPIVNKYLELLWDWIKSLEPGLTRKTLWPKDKEFAICLTHDVDNLARYRLRVIARAAVDILKSRLMPKAKKATHHDEQQLSTARNIGVKDALNIICDWIKVILKLKKDPCDTFDYMLDLEREYGFKSSFYFMTGGNSRFDNRYSINEPRAVKLIRQIEDREDEVGLHGSYNSYNNLEQMLPEKGRLDKVVSSEDYGCRQHYLRWKTPTTWRTQEKAGLLYDTTLSFADHAGFRCGICLPFPPFDLEENRRLNTWELPLTVMEGSLRGYRYQNLSPEETYQAIIRYIDTVRRLGGVFVLLWHNLAFNPLGRGEGWKEVYEKVMKYMSHQNAWVTSGREIINWWSNSQHV